MTSPLESAIQALAEITQLIVGYEESLSLLDRAIMRRQGFPVSEKITRPTADTLPDSIKEPIEKIRAALRSRPAEEVNVPLERVKAAIDFYARREHWMSQTAEGQRVLLVALGPNKVCGNGWDEADAVEDDIWALGQLIEQLSQSKAEAMATIDRMNAEKYAAPPATQGDGK